VLRKAINKLKNKSLSLLKFIAIFILLFLNTYKAIGRPTVVE